MSNTRARERLLLAGLLLAGAVVFCAGITWGLPSRATDHFLFGEHPVWTGREILQLAGDWTGEAAAGADVDTTPLLRSGAPVALNETDEQRAQILIRYRLYTYQPDEMITLRSLGRMRPRTGDFDPRLYQYGGLWIYPVGALIGVASRLGLVELTQDKAFYLDHPEAFARFYLVARAYSAAWGLIGILCVYRLARRLHRPTDGVSVPALLSAATFLLLPVVINMAHEAKPHLPAAVLMLVAVLAAVRYVETGRTRCGLITGLLCGLSFGTVLSALPVFAILPLMVMLRKDPGSRRLRMLLASVAAGAVAYGISNPYVVINAVAHRDVLFSNLGNSTGMYRVGGWSEGIRNGAYLLMEACSPVAALLGVISAVAVVSLRGDRVRELLSQFPRDQRLNTGILLAGPAVCMLIQFVALAAGKPGEYGRFLVYPAAVLAMSASCCLHVIQPIAARRWHVIVLIGAGVFGGRYVYAFVHDVVDPGRVAIASILHARPEPAIYVRAEPAPYVMPPFDLFERHLVLDDQMEAPPAGALLVVATDDPARTVRELPAEAEAVIAPAPARQRPLGETLISWADKPILIIAPR